MSEKKLKAPIEVVKKASQALQNSNSTPDALAEALQLPLLTVQNFFAGEAIEQVVALKICKKLNILPQSSRTSIQTSVKATEKRSEIPAKQGSEQLSELLPEIKVEKVAEKSQRDRANFFPNDPLLDAVFATEDDDFKGELNFEVLPNSQPIASPASPKGFLLLGDPEEPDFEAPINRMPPLTKPIIYRHEEEPTTEITIPELPINQDRQDYQEHLSELVTELRDRLSNLIEARYSKLRILGMNRSIPITEIYVEPRVWPVLPSDRWLGITELEDTYTPKSFLLHSITKGFGCDREEESISLTEALNQHRHLVILGGLGSGKTTVLKYLAQECLSSRPQLIPLYLELRTVAQAEISSDFSFTDYLIQYLVKITGIDSAIAITLLKEGRFWLLLDGLESVPKTELHRLTQEIGDFAALYHQNAIAIASRMALANVQLQEFGQVELADFDPEQIKAFSEKWFGSWEGFAERAEPFLHQVNGDRRLSEIATNPLCLTMQCLAYGRSDFFALDIFRETLRLWLKLWQESQAIYFVGAGSKLSALQKSQILAEFAFKMIEQNQYFFGAAQLHQQIQILLASQADFSFQLCDQELLIEEFCWQHGLLRVYARGVYGFTQPAWQEYLAAKWVATNNNPEVQKQLLKYVDNPSWHSVFIFVAGILANSDQFLTSLQQAINALVSSDLEVQRYLSWGNQQATSLKAQYKPVVIRAMYCDVDFERMRVLDRNRALQIAHGKSLERARMKSLGMENDNDSDTAFEVDRAMEEAIELDLAMDFSKQRILSLARLLEPKMDRRLGWLGGQIPDPQKNQSKFMKWWQAQGGEWAKILRETILQYRKTIKDWEFTEPQLALLRRYHYANILLIECLNNSRQVSHQVQQEIEETLLKPHI
jgi:NACHT domain